MIHGNKCPHCRSNETDGRFVSVSVNDRAFQEMHCLDCDGQWTNVYKLINQIPKQRTQQDDTPRCH